MLTIEQIKKAVKYAEGFEVIEDHVNHEEALMLDGWWVRKDSGQYRGMYPLFLQRVIEGINKADGRYRIEQCYDMIDVLGSEEYDVEINFLIKDNPDQAKELAIKWVLKHDE